MRSANAAAESEPKAPTLTQRELVFLLVNTRRRVRSSRQERLSETSLISLVHSKGAACAIDVRSASSYGAVRSDLQLAGRW